MFVKSVVVVLFLSILSSLFLFSNYTVADSDKAIYGDDNRYNVLEYPDEKFREFAKSTAAMLPNESVQREGLGIFTVHGVSLYELGLSADERFAKQLKLATCSGFLVADDLLVTAGHCIKNKVDCANNKWIFDFSVHNQGIKNKVYVFGSDIYQCRKVLSRSTSLITSSDYVLIRLDRKVEGRAPLKFRTKGKISNNAELVMIGHPSGLPTKIADHAIVRKNEHPFYFVTNLDSFAGNSGSAVFDKKTGIVEGILVQGETDYVYDEQTNRYRAFRCKNDGCRGEDVVRITVIPELAPSMIPYYSRETVKLYRDFWHVD